MKRFIVTMHVNTLEGVTPLFDLVVYGASVEEAGLDHATTRDAMEVRLRRRNLSLDDFAGWVISAPMEMPKRACEHVYVEPLRG